ncbi:MAG: hypothetical protein AB7F22_35350 [Reyranella sp.]|uniref:hypothetical protein n=1 Tax=Reyranella sp. TaxID=1929291 RepID=UPI003D0F484F
MSLTCHLVGSRLGGGPTKPGRLGAADWLSLAAAPTFAGMALLSAILGGGPLDALCAASPGVSVLTGMVPMYVLMSAFHATPWLRRPRRPGRSPRDATPRVTPQSL